VRWAWLDWGLSGWLTTLLQCFDTVGWVIRPVKYCPRNDCVEWDGKPYSTSALLLLISVSHPPIPNMLFVLPGVITSLCLDTVSARICVGHLLLSAKLPGTHWAMICVIRRLALTVSYVCWKLGCFQSTSAYSTLEVLHLVHCINSWLTYFQTYRVPTPHEKCWIFFLKMPGPGKISLNVMHFSIGSN